MASNINEVSMKMCRKCYYFFPEDDLKSHEGNCGPVNSRIDCPLCNCDYNSVEIESHVELCRGFIDKIEFISEYSRKKYSHTTIRKFLKTLGNSEHDYSNCKGREVLRTINDNNFNINKWISTDKESTIECPICICEVMVDDIFVLDCNDDHKLCYDCLYQHALSKLNVNSALTCPIGKCNQIIHLNELNSLPFPKHVVRTLVQKYNEQLFNAAMSNTEGAIKCPNNTCKWVAIFDTKDRINVECKACHTDFCSICRARAHFRIECNDLPRLLQDWMNWCNTGRNMRQSDMKKIKKAATDVKKAQERNDLLKKNFEQLKKDENFKSENCKLCPNCRRVVQK